MEAQKYRLQKINEIQTILTEEVEKRTILSKKYHKWVKLVGGVDDVLVGYTVVLEAIAVALLATAVLAPAIIPIQVAVIGIGSLVTAGSQVKKKLFKKEGKHEKTAVLAQDKLSAVSDCISKALDDEEISKEEYSLIVSELDNFREMKEKIRAKVKNVKGATTYSTTYSDKESFSQRLSRVMTTNSVENYVETYLC